MYKKVELNSTGIDTIVSNRYAASTLAVKYRWLHGRGEVDEIGETQCVAYNICARYGSIVMLLSIDVYY